MVVYDTARQTALVTALSYCVVGCYQGVSGVDSDIAGQDGGATEGSSDGSGAEGGGADDGVGASCAEGARRVGVTALRRLTRNQYRRTVESLLGIDATGADGFTPDERVGPFTSNSVAPVADLQVEQYMDAAETSAEQYASALEGKLPCDPAVIGEQACAEQWLQYTMPRAYRRAVSDAELSTMMAVYQAAAADDGFTMGIQVMTQALLQSPWFVYHLEFGDDASGDGPRKLSDYELASRLSYFLWGTMPDDALFAAAVDGELSTSEGLEAQVNRMIDDPQMQAVVTDFHLQWLGLDELESLEKSGEAYPDFNPDLASAMKEDVSRFARWVFSEGDGRLETLLTGAFTLTDNSELLALYGVERPANHVAGTPIPLPEDERSGLLSLPGVMAWYGHADQSSPVHRGKLVRENFLCQPLPPPPPDVDGAPPDPDPDATTRERFEQHTEDPSCASCHVLIDGVGFGFEHYDGIGAYRSEDQGLPVDASGTMVGSDIDGDFRGAIELSDRLATSDAVQECVARQWFRYSLGRLDVADDSCSVEQISAKFADSNYDLRSLVLEVVSSDAFLYHRSDQESATIQGEE